MKERGSFAYNCLMARRLIERGTRFVQVMHAGWDQHRSVTTELYNQCRDTDQPSAGLIADLKQRGLLEDTLVVGVANSVARRLFRATSGTASNGGVTIIRTPSPHGWPVAE